MPILTYVIISISGGQSRHPSEACMNYYFSDESSPVTTFVSNTKNTQACPFSGRYQLQGSKQAMASLLERRRIWLPGCECCDARRVHRIKWTSHFIEVSEFIEIKMVSFCQSVDFLYCRCEVKPKSGASGSYYGSEAMRRKHEAMQSDEPRHFRSEFKCHGQWATSDATQLEGSARSRGTGARHGGRFHGQAPEEDPDAQHRPQAGQGQQLQPAVPVPHLHRGRRRAVRQRGQGLVRGGQARGDPLQTRVLPDLQQRRRVLERQFWSRLWRRVLQHHLQRALLGGLDRGRSSAEGQFVNSSLSAIRTASSAMKEVDKSVLLKQLLNRITKCDW